MLLSSGYQVPLPRQLVSRRPEFFKENLRTRGGHPRGLYRPESLTARALLKPDGQFGSVVPTAASGVPHDQRAVRRGYFFGRTTSGRGRFIARFKRRTKIAAAGFVGTAERWA